MSTAASIYFSHTHYDIKYVQIQNIITTAANSQLCELRIDYLIEDGRGPQWRPESAEIFIFRKYFMAVRKFTNIFVLLLILMVGSRDTLFLVCFT